jgi:alkylation response protein AidB-like acyl-CoA dehydrogenase
MPSEEEILQTAEAYLQQEVSPRAADIDADPEALRTALRGLCERELMALRRPAEYGGPAINEAAFRHFQEMVARYSGSLAFLQTQHQSAGSMISKSPNEELKSQYLPKMGNGETLVGIGFSQLRRGGPPLMTAEPVEGGYRLNGHVPWVTGYSFYHEFLIGATLPDGQAVFGVVPFDNVDSVAEEELSDFVESTSVTDQSAAGFFGASFSAVESSFRHPADEETVGSSRSSVQFSEPMKLAAMESALTVTAEFENWFLPDRLVCFIQPEDWIKNNDMINIVLQGHFALGCARGSLDVLKAAAEKKNLPFLHDAYSALDRELEECRSATSRGRLEEDGVATPEEKLTIRAWAIDLAVRCAHAAVAASSGAANSIKHPAQRLYREALVYTVSAQTGAIMEATLKRLVR